MKGQNAHSLTSYEHENRQRRFLSLNLLADLAALGALGVRLRGGGGGGKPSTRVPCIVALLLGPRADCEAASPEDRVEVAHHRGCDAD